MEEHHEHEEESENDEHIWLSLKNAQILCDAINDALSKVFPSKVDTLQKNSAVYKEKIAETIIANTVAKNQKILVLNSMQGKNDGETYLSVMAKNLEVLREALK